MKVMVYSYTQIECSNCKKLTVITPGKKDTKDIFQLECGCDRPKSTKRKSNGTKETRKTSTKSQ